MSTTQQKPPPPVSLFLSSTASASGGATVDQAEHDLLTRETLLLAAAKDSKIFFFRGKRGKEFRRRVMHFTPSWFSVCMGTGVTSILLYELPYQFSGLKIVADVIFGLNILLFFLFLFMSTLRYAFFPSIFPAMLLHPAQSLFLGTFSMGFSTLVNMTVFACAIPWGGAWITFAWTLWWINVVISVLIAIGLPYVMFVYQKHSLSEVSGIWFLPVVSTIVTSSSGGIVASVLPSEHAKITLVVSYVLWGTGFPVSILLMSLYFARLAVHEPPPSMQVISCFLPLGPCGQGGFAILQFAKGIEQLSSTPHPFFSMAAFTASEQHILALAVRAGTLPIALVIWGLGLFWAVIAIATVIRLAVRRSIPFGIGFWALIFPLGVWTSCTVALAEILDSVFFRVLGTVMSGAVTLLWLAVSFKTAIGGWRGDLFVAPCLSETPNGQESLLLNQVVRGQKSPATDATIDSAV